MKTSIYLRPEDAAKLAALGMTPGEAVRAFCAGTAPRPAVVQTPETVAALDKTARHPGDKLPDPMPPSPHGWTFTGTLQRQPDGNDKWVGQHIARPSSLDELSRLVSVAPGRVRFGSPHVLIVSEVSDER